MMHHLNNSELVMCMFCRSLFVLLYLFFWPLCCRFSSIYRFWLPFWYLQTPLMSIFHLNYVSVLCFTPKWVILQLYHGKNKLHFKEMMMKSDLYDLLSTLTIISPMWLINKFRKKIPISTEWVWHVWKQKIQPLIQILYFFTINQ
jgi:hypothetical protein